MSDELPKPEKHDSRTAHLQKIRGADDVRPLYCVSLRLNNTNLKLKGKTRLSFGESLAKNFERELE